MPDYDELLPFIKKFTSKEAPAAEAGVNRAALDTLKAGRSADTDAAAQLSEANAKAPLTQKLDLSGIDKSKLPDNNTKPMKVDLNKPMGDVGETIPDSARTIDLDPNQDVGEVSKDNSPPKDDSSPLASKWKEYAKQSAPYVAAAGSGTTLGLMSGGNKATPVENSASTKASPPIPAEKSAPAKALNPSEDEEDDPTNDGAEISRPNAKGPVESDKTNQVNAVPEVPQNAFSIDRLAQLQHQSNQMQALNNLARGMTNAVATAGQQKTNLFDKQFEDQGKQIASMPEQYLQQGVAQKMDPKSPASVAARNLAQYIDPEMQINNQMSAADLEKVFPQMAIVKNSQDATAMRGEVAKNRQADRLNAQAIMLQKYQDMKDQKQQNAYNQTVQQLESTRTSTPAVQQAEKDVYAASKANQLVKSMGGNPDKLNPQQVQLLVSEVGKIASGQGTTDRTLDVLTPKTLAGQMAGVWQNLINHPTPANAGAFIKQYLQYANDISNIAKKEIKDRYGRIINSRSSQFNADQLQQLNNNYINRFDEPENTEDPVIKAAKMQAGSVVSKDTKAQADSAQQVPQTTPEKQVVKKGYNSKTDQTQLIYSDGTKEVVSGRQ